MRFDEVSSRDIHGSRFGFAVQVGGVKREFIADVVLMSSVFIAYVTEVKSLTEFSHFRTLFLMEHGQPKCLPLLEALEAAMEQALWTPRKEE